MRRHLTPLNVVATLVLVVSLLSASWAAPVRKLITGRGIKNSSITSADVKNRSLTAKDFKTGVLKGARGAQGATGAAGGAGAPGLAGQQGPAGAPGAPGAESPVSGASSLWAFRDSNDTNRVSLLASFGVPQAAALGPEALGFSDNLVYSFNVDQTHDGVGDVRFDFRFKTTAKPDAFLRATDPATGPTDATFTVLQTYTLTRTDAAGTATLLTDQPVAPPNLGPRSTPNYGSLAAGTIASTGGLRAFAGPRKAPEFMDAAFYDLLGLRPYGSSHLAPLPDAPGKDMFLNRNVAMIALQVPIASICPGACTTRPDDASVVGVYASTARRVGDGLVQTSRSGLPLVRELLTPLADRSAWSTTAPATDLATIARLRDPLITKRLDVDYPPLETPPAAPRDSLVDYLARGGAAELPAAELIAPNDLLKLNLATPVSGSPNALGVMAGDPQGFPNGRRLKDDVPDALVRLYAGARENPSATFAGALSDGVSFDSAHPAISTFPYAAAPISAYDG